MKLFKNKKAIEYATLLALIVVITAPYLWFTITEETGQFNRDIGDRQIGMLRAYSQGDSMLLYVDESMRLATKEALSLLAQQGGYAGTSCGGFSENDIRIINGEGGNYRNPCLMNPYDSMEKILKSKSNLYLQRYGQDIREGRPSIPIDNYEFTIIEDRIIGNALTPVEINILPPQKEIEVLWLGFTWDTLKVSRAIQGYYYIKPSFNIEYKTQLENYDKIKLISKDIIDCDAEGSISPEGQFYVERCIEEIAKKENLKWNYLGNNIYEFEMPQLDLPPISFALAVRPKPFQIASEPTLE